MSPRWSMTSVARASGPTSTTWWVYDRPLMPLRDKTIGSASSTPASTRTCRPRRAWAMASALTRSPGAAPPGRAARGGAQGGRAAPAPRGRPAAERGRGGGVDDVAVRPRRNGLVALDDAVRLEGLEELPPLGGGAEPPVLLRRRWDR